MRSFSRASSTGALQPSSGGRRPRRLAALSLSALLAGAALTGVASPVDAASASKPMMFGAAATSRQDVEEHERALGGRLNGLRVYKMWDSKLFASSQTWARDSGHTLFLSIRSRRTNGSNVKWADVANARPGSRIHDDMLRQAREIKAFRAPVFISYNHEPEAHESWSNGSGAQFIAAWRKVISTWRAAGVTNAKYVFTATAYGFDRKDARRVDNYYPGDAYVDHIAADGYNWYRCRDRDAGWRELSSVIEGHRRFGLKHPSKGLMLWEFGSAEDRANPGRKAQWLRNATSLFQKPGWGQYRAVLSWEGRNFSGSGPDCGFDYKSSAAAKKAWVDMARSPAFGATRVG